MKKFVTERGLGCIKKKEKKKKKKEKERRKWTSVQNSEKRGEKKKRRVYSPGSPNISKFQKRDYFKEQS